MPKRRPAWDAGRVKALRRHLDMTQEQMGRELGTRQQTISEWETGLYSPRGLSERLLSMVAERAGFQYRVQPPADSAPESTAE
jgi:DNA-binding transcriptional regulator YiaG